MAAATASAALDTWCVEAEALPATGGAARSEAVGAPVDCIGCCAGAKSVERGDEAYEDEADEAADTTLLESAVWKGVLADARSS